MTRACPAGATSGHSRCAGDTVSGFGAGQQTEKIAILSSSALPSAACIMVWRPQVAEPGQMEIRTVPRWRDADGALGFAPASRGIACRRWQTLEGRRLA